MAWSAETREKIARARARAGRICTSSATAERRTRARSRYFPEVPKWVPADLVAQYLETARVHGEEDAAKFVRELKAQRTLK